MGQLQLPLLKAAGERKTVFGGAKRRALKPGVELTDFKQ